MPPRYVYWTILIDGKATAFRAREREELLPTFNQLARKNTDLAMRYFVNGKLWDSPEQAEWAKRHVTPTREPRGHEWRPGGKHADPRARFATKRRDAKPGQDARRARDVKAALDAKPARDAKPGQDAKPAGNRQGRPGGWAGREHHAPEKKQKGFDKRPGGWKPAGERKLPGDRRLPEERKLSGERKLPGARKPSGDRTLPGERTLPERTLPGESRRRDTP